jgi:hypothetical protein
VYVLFNDTVSCWDYIALVTGVWVCVTVGVILVGENEVFCEKLFQVLCWTKIPIGVTWDRTRASSLRGRHNIPWVVTCPKSVQAEQIVLNVKIGPLEFLLIYSVSEETGRKHRTSHWLSGGVKCWKILFAEVILQQILRKEFFSVEYSLHLRCR